MHTFFLSDEHMEDKARHRRGKNAVYSGARRSFGVEGRDNGIPFEFHKEWEARIRSFHTHKSTRNNGQTMLPAYMRTHLFKRAPQARRTGSFMVFELALMVATA